MSKTDYNRDRSLPLVLLIGAVVIVAGLVFWQLQKHQPEPEPTAIPTAEVVAAPEIVAEPPPTDAAPTANPPPAETPPLLPQKTEPPLPSLDRSDADVIGYLLEASDGSFQSWLIEEHLVRKFVRAVNALEEGKLVSQYRPFADLKTPFSASTAGENWQIEPVNYNRYTPYLESLEQAGPERLVKIYKRYYPLLEQAYGELGVDKGSFDEVTIRALNRLAKAPLPAADTALTRPSVMYRFASADMEQRSAVEKLLFRLGPDNSRRLKALCESLLQELQKE